MLKIRCKQCNTEVTARPGQSKSCGCPNMATIKEDKISAVDLSKIVMLNSPTQKESTRVLTNEDIMWQEARRQRKVRRLDFEVR
jgi:hypothetical protein